MDDREERPQMIVEQEAATREALEAIIDNQLEEMNIVSFTQGDDDENGQ
jgi:DNA-binding LytR/AlgR family response regulator